MVGAPTIAGFAARFGVLTCGVAGGGGRPGWGTGVSSAGRPVLAGVGFDLLAGATGGGQYGAGFRNRVVA
jgi:hypothetical protein